MPEHHIPPAAQSPHSHRSFARFVGSDLGPTSPASISSDNSPTKGSMVTQMRLCLFGDHTKAVGMKSSDASSQNYMMRSYTTDPRCAYSPRLSRDLHAQLDDEFAVRIVVAVIQADPHVQLAPSTMMHPTFMPFTASLAIQSGERFPRIAKLVITMNHPQACIAPNAAHQSVACMF